MPKADFEFYHIDGVKGEFVTPSPASDPYRGAYDIPAVPELALKAIAGIVEDYMGPTVAETYRSASRDETTGYFFNTKLPGYEVLRQRATMTVKLQEEDGYYSKAFNSLFGEMSVIAGKIVLPTQHETPHGSEAAEIVAHRDYAGIEENLCLLDDNDEPTHPSMIVRQLVPIRAYRWLPGPERKGKNITLPATYSPRPVNLAAAQLIEIKGINPLAIQ